MAQAVTFHQAVAQVLLVSQIYALLPISNVGSQHAADIRFRWLSARVCYAAFICLLNFAEFGSVLHYVSIVGINFHTSSALAFYVVCLLEHVYFWQLAFNWHKIMSHWQHVEQPFLKGPYCFYNEFKMKRRINLIVALVMTSALVEHCLLLANSFHSSNLERIQCNINASYLESLFKWERPHLHYILPYRVWFLPLLEWINQTVAYARSFTDCFIMCIGIGLAARFHQLHCRIASVRKRILPAIFWTEVRQNYLALKRLMRLLDKAIAPLVLLAFGNNMSFICFQLFNSFKNIGEDFIVVLAFWYSLLFAIIRTALTISVSSGLNDYQRKMLKSLRDVPSRAWNIELQRFSDQLGNDMSALSGNGFFYLTRQLVLAMATTIITYELMISDVINQSTIRQRTIYC